MFVSGRKVKDELTSNSVGLLMDSFVHMLLDATLI